MTLGSRFKAVTDAKGFITNYSKSYLIIIKYFGP